MSDEESFVILGTSPLSSLNTTEALENDGTDSIELFQESQLLEMQSSCIVPVPSPTIDDAIKKVIASRRANGDAVRALAKAHGVSTDNLTESLRIRTKTDDSSNGEVSSASVRAKGSTGSLAASFILGEVNADVLKTSVYSQFPSLCSMEACAEDAIKLQNLMSEYLELKNTLAKVNTTMKQFYGKASQWREDMQRMEHEFKQQLQVSQKEIANLRNEKLELEREIDKKMEHMKCQDELRQHEHNQLLQTISEKTEEIDKMCSHIHRLELNQLDWNYNDKNKNDFEEQTDYVDRLEHERVVKEFENKMSTLFAENLDLKDVQKQYVDEITCLKVNLTAAEELIKQSKADINLLKAKDMENCETFAQYEQERCEMKEEFALLRQQVDIYRKDFELERTSRQNLAGEKDQILQDLRALQRKNQELIEFQQKRLEYTESLASGSDVSGLHRKNQELIEPQKKHTDYTESRTSATPQPPPEPRTANNTDSTAMRCPICSTLFTSITLLQRHINLCLDNN